MTSCISWGLLNEKVNCLLELLVGLFNIDSFVDFETAIIRDAPRLDIHYKKLFSGKFDWILYPKVRQIRFRCCACWRTYILSWQNNDDGNSISVFVLSSFK